MVKFPLAACSRARVFPGTPWTGNRRYVDKASNPLRRVKHDLAELVFLHVLQFRVSVPQAMARLDAYHGVIIADVVGLGKSIIGGLLGAVRSKRGLIICPPGLAGDPSGTTGGWYEYKNKFKLHDWEIWSRGKLDDLTEKLKKDPDFDMVIVDEAHNFRSERTEDYGLLADICFGKEVVLLTATPFNNRPSDLLALLHLFSPGKQSPFVVGGELDERFRFFMQRYENILKLNKAIAREDYDAIEKQLKACGIEPLTCNCGRDLTKTRQAAARRLPAARCDGKRNGPSRTEGQFPRNPTRLEQHSAPSKPAPGTRSKRPIDIPPCHLRDFVSK